MTGWRWERQRPDIQENKMEWKRTWRTREDFRQKERQDRTLVDSKKRIREKVQGMKKDQLIFGSWCCDCIDWNQSVFYSGTLCFDWEQSATTRRGIREFPSDVSLSLILLFLLCVITLQTLLASHTHTCQSRMRRAMQSNECLFLSLVALTRVNNKRKSNQK